MDLVDLIVAIVVVTILVTVVVGLATYVAYKLRLARRPGRAGEEEAGTRYFFLHEPPEDEAGDSVVDVTPLAGDGTDEGDEEEARPARGADGGRSGDGR
ncbi:MAG: hypothetical protein ACOC83_07660 [Gemmatimonadota bacterium]